ncbi:unnamed protein product [Clonostachys byssicola]|uniref:Major facilitator superfamily (MFS) profile domain-containing protein n=1 Tax=Clonostachys byssicola TaxID=160290 RepID=A0A9N9UQB7_9HYPO|nr:unnamed protein product [Clonostachys byssicola]
MGHANVIIGLLHSAFSVGCIAGPFLAGSLTNIGSRPWYHWYIVMCAFSFVGLVLLSFAFWPQDSDEYRTEIAQDNEDNSAQNHQWFPATLFKAETLVGIGFVFICLGVEASITSWIPTYIKRSRNGGDLSSSLCVSFFHIGMATGRLTMGYMTDIFGLYRPMTIAICAALACQVLFFLVVTSSSSTAIVGILGFFIGPGYPSAMIALTNLLPANERVGTTSIVNSAGQVGAAILPFALGTLSGRFGIEVFNYIVSGEILALLVLWRWLVKTSSKER